MKKALLRTSALVAASLLTAGQVAQAGGHADQGKGARAGSFTLSPKLSIEQISDDNFYKEKSGASSKNYTVINPSVTIKSDWGSNELRINGAVTRDQFNGSSADNSTESDVRLRFRLDASKSSEINFEGRTRNLVDDRGDDNTSTDDLAPTEYNRTNWGVKAKFKPNRIGFELGAKVNKYDYDDTAKEGGSTTNNDDRDRTENSYSFRAGYEIQKGYEAFLRANIVDIDYDSATDDNSENRDSDGHTIEAGLKVELSKLVDADIGFGQIKREFDESTFKDISEGVANAKITWHATPITKIRLSASRDLNETTTSSASANLATSYGIGLDHEFRRNLKAKMDYKTSTTDYEDSSNNRSDDKDKFEIALDYEINRTFSFGLKYVYEERDSNINTNDYDRNIVSAKLVGKF
jgi:hypothetical protein